MRRQYWRFFWPLSLMGVAMLLARQFQNGALARYGDAGREIAVFAIASSVLGLFVAPLAFVPMMSNVLARSRRGHRICLECLLAACAILTAPVAFLAFARAGRATVAAIFAIEGGVLDSVIRYLRFLLPVVLLAGLRNHYTGLLVQAKRTGAVTLLNLLSLATVIGVLVGGFHAGWPAVRTLATAEIAASVLHLAATWLCVRRWVVFADDADAPLSYREAFSFFWPIATTGAMFAISRPILYALVGRGPNPEPVIAALRVSFDFGMMFQNPMNQFRHLFATFGCDDLPGVRRFMIRAMFVLATTMFIVAATPLSLWLYRDLLGVGGDVLRMARQATLVLCLVPVVMALRNYFHGQSLVDRKTTSLAVGSVLRNLAIAAAAGLLLAVGWLNHVTAAGVLVLGFFSEALGVIAHRARLAALPVSDA